MGVQFLKTAGLLFNFLVAFEVGKSRSYLKSETFLLSDNTSRCLIFIEKIVYFDKQFAMSLWTYYPDNASYKIIIFSLAWTSGRFDWNNPLITLSLHLRGRVVTKGREIVIFVNSQPPFDVH